MLIRVPRAAPLLSCLLILTATRPAAAASLNVATLSCTKYQNEVLAATAPDKQFDPIDTVMWLFGYSVARAGAHLMYGDALAAFGFALDAQCKNNPAESLEKALAAVKVDQHNPMDLSSLDCGTYAQRHAGMKKSDPESAATIMMWLYGFQVGRANGHVLDTGRVGAFETTLLSACAASPLRSVYDTLSTLKF